MRIYMCVCACVCISECILGISETLDTHFTLMSNYRLNWLADWRSPEIPYMQILIIPSRTKQIFMPPMPCHIFYDPFMNLFQQISNCNNNLQITQNGSSIISVEIYNSWRLRILVCVYWYYGLYFFFSSAQLSQSTHRFRRC